VNQQEVAILLALANAHDQRQGVDDIKVQAWHLLFEQEAPKMSFEFAQEQVHRHYALFTEMLMPAHLVTRWKIERRQTQDRVRVVEPGVPMPDWFKEKTRDIGYG
jgi:hypothetical protein